LEQEERSQKFGSELREKTMKEGKRGNTFGTAKKGEGGAFAGVERGTKSRGSETIESPQEGIHTKMKRGGVKSAGGGGKKNWTRRREHC